MGGDKGNGQRSEVSVATDRVFPAAASTADL